MIIDSTNSASAVTQRATTTAAHIGAPAQNSGLKTLRRDKADDERGVHDDLHVGGDDDQQMQDMSRLRTMARGGDTTAPNGQAETNSAQQRPPDFRFGAWGQPGQQGGSTMGDTVRGFVDRATDGIKKSFDRMTAALQPSAGPGQTNANWANPGWPPSNAGWAPPNAGWAPPAAGWARPGLQSPPPFSQEHPQVFGGPPNVAVPNGGPMTTPSPMMAPSPMMGMFPGAQMNKSTMMAMFMSMMPGGMMLAMPFMFMSQMEHQKQMARTLQGAMGASGYGPPMGPPAGPQWNPAQMAGGGQASSVGQPWNPAPVPPAVAAISENVQDFHNHLQMGTPIPARNYVDASNRLNDQVGYWMQDHSNDAALGPDEKRFAADVRTHVQGYLQSANEQLRASGVPNDQKEVHFTRFLAEAITRDAGPQGPRFPGMWVAGQQLLNAGLPQADENIIAGGNMVGMGGAPMTAPTSAPAAPAAFASAASAAPVAPQAAPAPPPPVTVSEGFAQNQGVIQSCHEVRRHDGTTLQRVAQILPKGADPSQMLTLTEDVAKGTLTVTRGDDVVSVSNNVGIKLPAAGSGNAEISIEDKNRQDRGSYETASQSIGADGSVHYSHEKFNQDRHEPYKYWERDTQSIHSSASGELSGTASSRWQTGNDNFKRKNELKVSLDADGTLRADGTELKPFIPFDMLIGK